MAKENSDFWEKEFEGINMDGINPESKLSPTRRKVIQQRCKALRGLKKYAGISVLGRMDIKADIVEFSRRLGATEEEIELDILPSLGL